MLPKVLKEKLSSSPTFDYNSNLDTKMKKDCNCTTMKKTNGVSCNVKAIDQDEVIGLESTETISIRTDSDCTLNVEDIENQIKYKQQQQHQQNQSDSDIVVTIQDNPIKRFSTASTNLRHNMIVDENTLHYIFPHDQKTNLNVHSAPNSPRTSITSPNITILPIDDNEYAYVCNSTDNSCISYEIVSTSSLNTSGVTVKPMLSTTTVGIGHVRSCSFQSFMFDNESKEDVQKYPSIPQVINYRPDYHSTIRSTAQENLFNTHSLASSPIDMCSYYENSLRSIDSPVKEKNGSIFEPNGLFIKRNHPIFLHDFSKKVFIGGLPRDISIDSIKKQFSIFGDLYVDWPNRDNEHIPPNGFAFLHFEQATSVDKIYELVNNTKNKNKFTISSNSTKTKEVEVKFWKMSDCEYVSSKRNIINTSYTAFVGALPRITTASELAKFMQRMFGEVVYTAIDVDLVYGYPKGAGRVTFRTNKAYNNALHSHYTDMDVGNNNGKKKKIEIKQFLLTDQKCDICILQMTSIQFANKYCYGCSYFICDTCLNEQSCIDGTPHNPNDTCDH